jgi:hypothetical protein
MKNLINLQETLKNSKNLEYYDYDYNYNYNDVNNNIIYLI